MNKFSHLHTHSEYSVRDGLSRVSELVDKALRLNMPAIALTDHGNMNGIASLFRYCREANQLRVQQGKSIIKPIAGCELFVTCRRYHLVLLAKNLQGYLNLCRITEAGFHHESYRPGRKPIVEWCIIEQFHEGLICLSGCIGGELGQTVLNGEDAEPVVDRHLALFGEDYYIEIQRHKTGKENACTQTFDLQKRVEPTLLALAARKGIKVVATNDSHFLNEEDAEVHDALLQRSYARPGKPTFHFSKQEWLKSSEEMTAAFSDIPEVLRNTQEVVDKVEIFDGSFTKSSCITAVAVSGNRGEAVARIAKLIGVDLGIPVGVCSQDSPAQIAKAFLSVAMGSYKCNLLNGKLTDEDVKRLEHHIGLLEDAPIYISDGIASFVDLLRNSRMHVSEEKVCCIVVNAPCLHSNTGDTSIGPDDLLRQLQLLSEELAISIVAII